MIATTAARMGLASVVIAALSACGSTNPPIELSVSPAVATVQVGGTQQFTASVLNVADANVTWSVAEASGGTVSAGGLYTAPSSTGSFHVVATSAADPTKSASAAVSVVAASTGVNSVAVSPNSAAVATGATFQFVAQVNGASSAAVTWSVASGGLGGTISATGLYTAPASTGRDAVIATSTADPTQSGSAAVTVTRPATPSLTYATGSLTCTLGTFCTLAAPTNSGGAVVSLSIAPALPAGLSFDTTSGAISGTATALATASVHIVTATNPGGSSAVFLSVAVDAVVPSQVTYSSPALICTVGVPCSLAAPANSGGAVVSYSVSPALPSGLSVNATSGAISGTAAALSPSTSYSITATNSGGSASALLSVSVIDVAPSQLTYASTSLVCTVGVPCNLAAPTHQGGVVLGYSVSPSLPSGLALDPSSGAISGTPSAITGSSVYVVSSSNSGGTALASLSVVVNDVPPSQLVYASASITCTKGVSCSLAAPQSQGGAVVSFSVSPLLPSGISLNTSTGTISGSATVLSTATSYTVTATNSGGQTTASVSITVIDAAPTSLLYSPNSTSCAQGTFCSLGPPTHSGGAVVTYSIAATPLARQAAVVSDVSAATLPAGLALDTSTGTISGTPTVISSARLYTVTATNTGGQTTTSVTITITQGPPANLTYSSTTLTCVVGTACSLGAPTNTGGAVSSYAVNPPLPDGLVLDTNLGGISGTPTTPSASASYLVTATNPIGNTTASLTVTVNQTPPAGLTYSPSTLNCSVGLACSLAAPTSTGGSIDSYGISPTLPDGLAIGSDGSLSGTPTAASTSSSYTVTATNSAGQTTASVTVSVSATPWIALGPSGGTPLQIVFDPNNPGTLYAMMQGGALFRSADSGATWSFSGKGLEGAYANSLVLGPTAGTLYAGSSESGIYGSTDSGATWTQLGFTTPVLNVAADPFVPGRLYLFAYVEGEQDSVYLSTDNGATWNASDTGIDRQDNGDVYAVPGVQGVLYVSDFLHVFKSVDSGATWTESDTGIPSSNADLDALTIDPTNPANLYIASVFNGATYSSNNSGASWTTSTSGIVQSDYPSTIVVDPTQPSRLFLNVQNANNGTLVSNDSGATWSPFSTSPADAHPYAVGSDGTIYISDGSGLFTSTDVGATWQSQSVGLDASQMFGVAVAPNGTLYATGVPGTYSSTDQGQTWTLLDPNYGMQVLIDPTNPMAIVVLRGNDSQVQTSLDGGETWTVDEGTNFYSLTFASNGTLYAGGEGVFISTTDGQGFIESDEGLSSGDEFARKPDSAIGGEPAQIYSLAVQADNQTVLAVGNNALYLSTDGGQSWNEVQEASGDIFRVAAIDPSMPGTFYVGGDNFVYGSSDGESFSQLGQLPGVGGSSEYIAVSPGADHTIYVGDSPFGIAASTDSGATFQQRISGLVASDTRGIAFANGLVYVAAYGGGILVTATGGL